MAIVGVPTGGPDPSGKLLDAIEVSKLSKNELAKIRNQKIGFVFQGFNLLSRTTALENVELMLKLNGRLDRAGRECSDRVRQGVGRIGDGGCHPGG